MLEIRLSFLKFFDNIYLFIFFDWFDANNKRYILKRVSNLTTYICFIIVLIYLTRHGFNFTYAISTIKGSATIINEDRKEF